MTTAEIILKWAELALQGQVLAFALVIIGFVLWKKEIARLISAIAERGGKFKAGPVSGEISAGLEDETKLVEPRKSIKQKPETQPVDQEKEIYLLASKFDAIKHAGAGLRSSFVEKLRRDQANKIDWEILKGSLNNNNQSIRFVASSLLANCVYELDAEHIANKLIQESSSLVRYRYLDALASWLKTSKAILNEVSIVGEKLSVHEEENIYVAEKLNKLKNTILKMQYEKRG
jgi:hypothetical protein